MRILAVTAAALLLAVLVPPPSGADAKWTFLVYLDADNNLEEVGIDDFLLGALLLLAVADPGLLVGLYLTGDRLYGFLLVILITWGLHRAVNVIGFRLGKKKEPW